jgi:phage FluMu gp28-like protein
MNVNITGADLFPWQEIVADSYINGDFKTYILNIARQQGKSLLISQLILYSAINNDNAAVGVVSLTYKQVKLIYSNVSELLKQTPIVQSDNKSELKIYLVNGSVITFLTVQNPDNIRGHTFSHLFCDEMAFYQPDVWNKVLLPTTLAMGRKVVLASTPRGTNHFYDLFMRGMNEDDKSIISFKFDYTANPFFNKDEIETIRKQLPEAIFRQEFLCEFSDNGSVFNNLRDICIHQEWPQAIGNLFCGIDVGLFHDYAVATILDASGNLVDMYRSKTGSINNLNSELEVFLKKWKPTKTLIELNNVGVSVYEHLQPRIRGIEGFKTTAISKGDLINQLQNSIDDKRIKLPTHNFIPEVYNELVNYGFKYSEKTRQIQYEAIAGHDDIVMSLALANKIFVEANFSVKPKVSIRIGLTR